MIALWYNVLAIYAELATEMNSIAMNLQRMEFNRVAVLGLRSTALLGRAVDCRDADLRCFRIRGFADIHHTQKRPQVCG